jgi:apolipoprotein N-acyltransferase
MDRYTILKWKEACLNFKDVFLTCLSGLYAFCNTNRTTRLVSLGVLFVFVLLLVGIVSFLRPEAPVSITQKMVLTATDSQDNLWRMEYLKDQNLQDILSGPVKPGQPLTLTVKFLRKQSELLIKPEIAGAAGERYFPGILKNGQWQDAPKLVIKDSNDKLVHKGKFEYG